MGDATVLVVGLGDLGVRVLQALARLPEIGWLVGASRDVERGTAYAAQAALIAHLAAGPRQVLFRRLDVLERTGTVGLLRQLDPDIVVMAASQHTWWRARSGDPARVAALAALPYGAWLSLHLRPVRALMEARREAGVRARVVCLPLPDIVGPALAPLGLAPDIGAGNVTQAATKLAILAADSARVDREAVRVRLVMHHAVERLAFGLFASLGGAESEPAGDPPWLADVSVQGDPVPAARVDTLFHAPYALPSGTASQELTAAATAHLVAALLSEQPQHTHAPAPQGRPGGYPVLVSRDAITLDLPPGVDEARARAINELAARWDGIEQILADGTIVFTEAIAAATERILGRSLERIAPDEQAALADDMARRAVRV